MSPWVSTTTYWNHKALSLRTIEWQPVTDGLIWPSEIFPFQSKSRPKGHQHLTDSPEEVVGSTASSHTISRSPRSLLQHIGAPKLYLENPINGRWLDCTCLTPQLSPVSRQIVGLKNELLGGHPEVVFGPTASSQGISCFSECLLKHIEAARLYL